MRARISALLAVVAATLVLVAQPATAAPLWTITPGGEAVGVASPFKIIVGDAEIVCETATIDLDLESGTSTDNALGTIPGSPGTGFQNCTVSGFITVSVTQVGTWTLNAVAYDPVTGVVTLSIDGVGIDIAGPGCAFTIEGSLGARFANITSVLAVVPDQTLTVTGVDPVDNCLDLVHGGETGAVHADFVISPAQTITG